MPEPNGLPARTSALLADAFLHAVDDGRDRRRTHPCTRARPACWDSRSRRPSRHQRSHSRPYFGWFMHARPGWQSSCRCAHLSPYGSVVPAGCSRSPPRACSRSSIPVARVGAADRRRARAGRIAACRCVVRDRQVVVAEHLDAEDGAADAALRAPRRRAVRTTRAVLAREAREAVAGGLHGRPSVAPPPVTHEVAPLVFVRHVTRLVRSASALRDETTTVVRRHRLAHGGIARRGRSRPRPSSSSRRCCRWAASSCSAACRRSNRCRGRRSEQSERSTRRAPPRLQRTPCRASREGCDGDHEQRLVSR